MIDGPTGVEESFRGYQTIDEALDGIAPHIREAYVVQWDEARTMPVVIACNGASNRGRRVSPPVAIEILRRRIYSLPLGRGAIEVVPNDEEDRARTDEPSFRRTGGFFLRATYTLRGDSENAL